MRIAGFCVLLVAAAAACVWSPWAGAALVGALVLHLVHVLRLDAKPFMLAASALQRCCFSMPAFGMALAATAVAAVGTRPRRRLGWPSVLALVLVLYTLGSLWVRAAIEQSSLLPDVRATVGPTFYKYIAHALLLYVVLAVGLWTRGEARRALDGYLIALVPIAGLALVQAMHGDNNLLRFYWADDTPRSFIQPDFSRATSIFYDSNHLANHLVVGIFLALGRLVGARSMRTRVALATAVLLAAAALYCSASLGNWIALGVGTLVFVTLRRGWVGTAAVAFAIACLVVQLELPAVIGHHVRPALADKLTSLMQLDLRPEGPLGIRAVLQNAAIDMFHASPIVGVGYGAFQAHMLANEGLMRLTRNICYAHNSYLLVLAELGLLGFVLMLAMLVTHARLIVRLARSADREMGAWGAALCAALCACMVYEATYGSLLYDAPLWTVLGFAVGLRRGEARCT